MASLEEEFDLEYQKYQEKKRKEEQDGEVSFGTIFQFLEMALGIYKKLSAQQDDWEEKEAIFEEQVTLFREEKEKEEKKKGKRTLRFGKTTQRGKNKVKGRWSVGKQQEGGKQNKKREGKRRGGGGCKEKNKQGRKEGIRSLNSGKQDLKKKNPFRDNG